MLVVFNARNYNKKRYSMRRPTLACVSSSPNQQRNKVFLTFGDMTFKGLAKNCSCRIISLLASISFLLGWKSGRTEISSLLMNRLSTEHSPVGTPIDRIPSIPITTMTMECSSSKIFRLFFSLSLDLQSLFTFRNCNYIRRDDWARDSLGFLHVNQSHALSIYH